MVSGKNYVMKMLFYSISPRVSFLISIIISLVMYILSYPYSITSHPVLPYNGKFYLLFNFSHPLIFLQRVSMFSASGQASLWVMNGVITMAGIILWLAYFPRLKMYK
uniref:ABC transporter permease n=1 Tax=Heterorhabditis bacteriophora TaxID=37862 RepID=A0A1I7X2F1_HETBA